MKSEDTLGDGFRSSNSDQKQVEAVPTVYWEIADELLLQLEFYHDDETEVWYKVRPFSDIAEKRAQKLILLFECFYDVARIMFMDVNHDFENREQVFGIQDYEICRVDTGSDASIDGFRLGATWAEYKHEFGQINWHAWEREEPELKISVSPDTLERIKQLKEAHQSLQRSGARANTRIGFESFAAIKTYISSFSQDSLKGKTVTYLANDLTVEIEKFMRLKRKYDGGGNLSEQESAELDDLLYLEALTKNKASGLKPYASDTLRKKISEFMKSGTL